jgi:flagellar basal body rod protein FlgG
MFRALYTAASGMTAQQLNLDNISNNLANSSTTGFQQRRLQFSDLLYQNEIMPGSAATQQTTVAAGLQIGLGSDTRRLYDHREPSRFGDPGSRIFPDFVAKRTDGIYTRGILPS